MSGLQADSKPLRKDASVGKPLVELLTPIRKLMVHASMLAASVPKGSQFQPPGSVKLRNDSTQRSVHPKGPNRTASQRHRLHIAGRLSC